MKKKLMMGLPDLNRVYRAQVFESQQWQDPKRHVEISMKKSTRKKLSTYRREPLTFTQEPLVGKVRA